MNLSGSRSVALVASLSAWRVSNSPGSFWQVFHCGIGMVMNSRLTSLILLILTLVVPSLACAQDVGCKDPMGSIVTRNHAYGVTSISPDSAYVPDGTKQCRTRSSGRPYTVICRRGAWIVYSWQPCKPDIPHTTDKDINSPVGPPTVPNTPGGESGLPDRTDGNQPPTQPPKDYKPESPACKPLGLC